MVCEAACRAKVVARDSVTFSAMYAGGNMRFIMRERRERQVLGRQLLLGLVAVAALIFVGSRIFRGDAAEAVPMDAAMATDREVALVAAVDSLRTFVAEHDALRDATPDHGYTARGLRQVAAAFEAMASRVPSGDAALREGAALLRRDADRLGEDPRSNRHSDIVRDAFARTAVAVDTLQRNGYPNLSAAATAVRNAASAIRPDEPLLGQRRAIQRFFETTSEALGAMVATDEEAPQSVASRDAPASR
jgi:hypothetical protein